MALIEVKCPKCCRTNVIKHGRTSLGKQRYPCKDCMGKSFILDYTYNACKPGVEQMTANASGIRDISRVLGISTMKVMGALKNKIHDK